jgi:hypothetical protein
MMHPDLCYVYMYVCMHVSMCAFYNKQTITYSSAIYVICMCMCNTVINICWKRLYTCIYIYTHIHTHVHWCIYWYTHSNIPQEKPVHTTVENAHTPAYAYTHTHTHWYIYWYIHHNYLEKSLYTQLLKTLIHHRCLAPHELYVFFCQPMYVDVFVCMYVCMYVYVYGHTPQPVSSMYSSVSLCM